MNRRETGIELLRITSMFMVVMLHVLGQGGILYNSTGVNYNIALFLEILSFSAVNTFALISGYVGLNNKFRLHKLLNLLFQCLFYSIGITLVAYLLGKTISNRIIIMSIFPFSFNMWWYMSSYMCVFLFTPILNNAINNVPKKQLNIFFIFSFSILILLPQLLSEGPYGLGAGYSALWLILLYLFGGYLKKYNILKNISKYKSLLIYIMSSITVFSLIKIFDNFDFTCISNKLGTLNSKSFFSYFLSYLSPFIILNAIMLVSLFSKINIKDKLINKIICILSSASLGVFLIHVHKIPYALLKNRFITFINLPALELIIKTLSVCVIIYLGCTFIELLRILIFKIFKVKKLCKKIDYKLSKYLYEE